MPVSMTGSWNISGNLSMDSVAPLTSTVGATTTVQALQNQTLSSFNPIASVTGGYLPYTYYVSSGILPAGLALNSSTGLVSGIPTTQQNSAPTVFAVRDSSGTQSANTASVNFAVSTLPVVALVGTTSVSFNLNTPITSFYPFSSVSNGFAPYTYSISSGTLPTGVTLDTSTGLVSGTPTLSQGFTNVVFTVKDSQNNQAPTTATVAFIPPTYTINYLVVAGGGSGAGPGPIGAGAGGGGAGGMLTGNAVVYYGCALTVQVGGGAAAANIALSPGNSGFSSNVSGPATSGFTTITAIGGGAGGLGPSPGAAGIPGGSGGGAGKSAATSGTTLGGSGTCGQGNPGGNGVFSAPFGTMGGSGGGAGGAGTTYAGGAGSQGGPGLLWPYTNITYAGGGSVRGGPNTPGGGGGPVASLNGTPGLGGGGGGGGGNPLGPSGAGGSGTVIFAVPNAAYPTVVAPGAAVSTPPSAPGLTVLTYTTPTPTTPSTFTFIA